jgi:hypothetical protein
MANVSDISKNTLRIIVDNTNPIFDQQTIAVDAYVIKILRITRLVATIVL